MAADVARAVAAAGFADAEVRLDTFQSGRLNREPGQAAST
jgi:hypothetical protein